MLRWSIALFQVFGIRLEVHATFVPLVAYAAWLGAQDGGWAGLAWALTCLLFMFGVVVFHELGHCLAARRYGIRTRRILLLPIGGMAEFDSIPRQPRRELLVALAGPAVNFAALALLALVGGWPEELGDFAAPTRAAEVPGALLRLLFHVNLVMGVFNLLPAFPMDGGRALRALLAMRLDHLVATRWAARLGQSIALTAAGLAALQWREYALLAALFLFIAYGAELEYRLALHRDLYSGLIVANVTRSDFLAFSPEATVASALEALRRTVPQDLLLIGASGPVGVVPRARIAAALRAGRELEPLAAHADHEFAVLQADWALGPVVADLRRGRQRVFPVYSFDRLIGICDLGRVDEGARLIRHGAPRRR